MDNKTALMRTAVGRRLIAFYTIVNSGNMDRLRAYISDNFDETALIQQSVAMRMRWFQALHEKTGKLRVVQVMATDDHHVLLVAQGQNDNGLYLNEMQVSAEYPHKVLVYKHQPLE